MKGTLFLALAHAPRRVSTIIRCDFCRSHTDRGFSHHSGARPREGEPRTNLCQRCEEKLPTFRIWIDRVAARTKYVPRENVIEILEGRLRRCDFDISHLFEETLTTLIEVEFDAGE